MSGLEDFGSMVDLPGDPSAKCYLTICFVCRDVAKSGQEHLRNYGGIVCYSCRAFWRRSHQATRRPTFVCKKNGRCVITVTTRRRCQKCRYEKCASAGMKPDAVLDEDQKKVRFRKLLMKRQKQLAKQMKAKKGSGYTAKRFKRVDDDHDTESLQSDNSLECNTNLSLARGFGIKEGRQDEQQRQKAQELYHNRMFMYNNNMSGRLELDHQIHEENRLLNFPLKEEVTIGEHKEAKISTIMDSYVEVMKNLRCFKTDLVLNKLSALRSGYEGQISISKAELQFLMLRSSYAFAQFAVSLREFVSLDLSCQKELLSRNTPLFVQLFLGLNLLVEARQTQKDSRIDEHPKKKLWMKNFAQNLYLERFNSASGLFNTGSDLDEYGRLIVKLKSLSELTGYEQKAILAYILLFHPGNFKSKELDETYGFYIRTSEDSLTLQNLVSNLGCMANFCGDNIDWSDYDGI